jgi:hypothetical protein
MHKLETSHFCTFLMNTGKIELGQQKNKPRQEEE